MKEEARRIRRVAERLSVLAGAVKIAADVLRSLAKSIDDLAEVMEEDDFATVSEV